MYLYSRAKAFRTNSSISLISWTDTASGCPRHAQDVWEALTFVLILQSVLGVVRPRYKAAPLAAERQPGPRLSVPTWKNNIRDPLI